MEKFKSNQLTVPIGKVVPNNWNPKDSLEESPENKERFEQIKKGLEKYGLMSPIVVRQTGDVYEIIDGYHRWLGCNELGFENVLINDLGEMSNEQAKSLTLLFEKAKVETNTIKEAVLLKEIYEIVGSYEEMEKMLPYNATVIQDKVELVEHDWDSFEEEGNASTEEDEVNITFTFKVDRVFSDECNKALLKAGEDKDVAFVNICEHYLKHAD